MTIRVRIACTFCALFFTLLYLSPGAIAPGSDARASMYLPSAVLDYGTLRFSPAAFPFMFVWRADTPAGPKRAVFRNAAELERALSETTITLVGPKYYLSKARDGRGYVNTFGPVPGLLAVVSTSFTRLVAPAESDARTLARAAYLTASLLVALSVALVFAAARRLTTTSRSALIALSYGAGTCAFSVSSQALWQHGACSFFLALAAYALVRIEQEQRGAVLCAVALSLAVWTRQSTVLAALPFAFHVARYQPSLRMRFFLTTVPFALALAAYDTYFFGAPWRNGQTSASFAIAKSTTGLESVWSTTPWEGALGLLVSPGRGLVPHSPILLFALAGLLVVWFARGRDLTHARFVRTLALATLGTWLVAFAWFDWWGGWCFGYRPLVDALPLLALGTTVPLARMRLCSAWSALFAIALAWSLAVQAVGAYAYNPVSWNDRNGQDVGRPEHRHRLWSWRDSQAAFFLTDFRAANSRRRDLSALWVDEPSR